MQTIIAIILLVVAIAFLGWKYIAKRWVQSSQESDSCGPNCNCS